MVFVLPEPRGVSAIRLRISYWNSSRPLQVEVFWKKDKDKQYTTDRYKSRWLEDQLQEQTVTIHVQDVVQYLKLKAGFQGCTFKIRSLELLESSFQEGSLDTVNDSFIAGWAWDKDIPERTLMVDLYREGNLMAAVPADQPRADLLESGRGTGRYAFQIPTPMELKDCRPHTLRAFISGTNIELAGSPIIYAAKAP
jgi:hypothetical protein